MFLIFDSSSPLFSPSLSPSRCLALARDFKHCSSSISPNTLSFCSSRRLLTRLAEVNILLSMWRMFENPFGKLHTQHKTTAEDTEKKNNNNRITEWLVRARSNILLCIQRLCDRCYYDYTLFFSLCIWRMYCVLSLAVLFLWHSQRVRAVGKFNQCAQAHVKCLQYTLPTHIIWYIILMKLMLFKDLFIILEMNKNTFLFIFTTASLWNEPENPIPNW